MRMPETSTTLKAMAGAGVAIVVAPVALTGMGFTGAGVAAGSVAAVMQSSMGSVAAGSTFAVLQSAGVAGTAMVTKVGLGGLGAAIGAKLGRKNAAKQGGGDDAMKSKL